MSDPIQPALSAEEWAKNLNDRGGLEIQAFPEESSISIQDWGAMSGVTVGSEDLPALIALANAALPDSDPRKITREMVDGLRREADRAEYADRVGDNAGMTDLDARRIADVLASYLPLERP
jgi:hypothetical protein